MKESFIERCRLASMQNKYVRNSNYIYVYEFVKYGPARIIRADRDLWIINKLTPPYAWEVVWEEV